MNYNIVIQNTGEAALRYITNLKTLPVLVIVDYHLPDNNGVELMQKIKSTGIDVVCIM